jgi:hypothetical protein
LASARYSRSVSAFWHEDTIASRYESKAEAPTEVPVLEIKTVVQHGHIFEIEGLAEAGSTVMINDEKVATFGDSSFKYFVGPLSDGVTVLTITVQNERGGVNTKQVALTLP